MNDRNQNSCVDGRLAFVRDNGGRTAAGFKGDAGDCVVRAVTIATQQSYQTVYDALTKGCRTQRLTKLSKYKGSSRDGVNTHRKWFRDYMASIGWKWTPTMQIGSGCKVHLTADELPRGRLIVAVSKHYTTVIDGVIHDTHDPQRAIHVIEPDHGQALKPGQWRNVNGIARSKSAACMATGVRLSNYEGYRQRDFLDDISGRSRNPPKCIKQSSVFKAALRIVPHRPIQSAQRRPYADDHQFSLVTMPFNLTFALKGHTFRTGSACPFLLYKERHMDTPATSKISASEIVGDAKRLRALPRHFGKHMMRVESAVYSFAAHLCDAYRGGYWKFYELSNGGFYMAPNSSTIEVSSDNYFSGQMSADAFGITVCLFALSNLCFSIDDESIARHFHLLRDFACGHAERESIFAAID